jgi:tetratricopeptide (TPR) repeat protein
MLNCALALRLQHRLRHFLDEQRNAVGTLDDVLADVGWQRLVADDALDHGDNFALAKPIDGEECHIRSSDPGRIKIRPECHDQQHTKTADPVDDPTEHFQARRVGPMRILEDHQHRILACQRLSLCNAETLKNQVAEIAQSQPELLAHHFTQAGMTEAAIEWWGTAGQRSMARYALVEGAEQLKRALDQIATLPATPALRREEIKLEVTFANALTLTGDFVDGKEHYDRALAIYDPAEHGPLTTRSGRDIRVALLASRSGCAWLLGYPAAARSDAVRAVKNAREIEHATTLLHALHLSEWNHIRCGNYAVAHTQVDELIALADQRGAPGWKALGTATRGCLFALTGKASEAVRAITSAITLLPSTGATLYEPQQLQYLAMAYAELGQLWGAARIIETPG